MPRQLFLEDVHPGDRWAGGPIVMDETDIIRFAEAYDPQEMHIDKAAAEKGRFGGLIASGWHVAALVMKDFVDNNPFGATPLLGLRIDALQWLKPVRPGDVLTIDREVLRVERSKSRPDRGVITMRMTVTNQQGEVALSFENQMQAPARSPGD